MPRQSNSSRASVTSGPPTEPGARVYYILRRSDALAEGHRIASARWSYVANVLGYPAALISAITGAAAFSSLPYSQQVTGVLALIVAVLTATNAFFKPSDKASKHAQAHRGYQAIVDETLPYVQSESERSAPSTPSTEQEQTQLREWAARIAKAFDDVNGGSPDLPNWAENRVRTKLSS